MSTHPEHGDDLMAIADAVGVTRPEPIHPSLRGLTLTDQALGQMLAAWSSDPGVVDDYFDHPDKPIPYLPTDHDVCHGCGDVLCGCEQHCLGLAEDVCGHNSRPYCPGCAPHHCHDCMAEQGRWGYDLEERGEWR